MASDTGIADGSHLGSKYTIACRQCYRSHTLRRPLVQLAGCADEDGSSGVLEPGDGAEKSMVSGLLHLGHLACTIAAQQGV